MSAPRILPPPFNTLSRGIVLGEANRPFGLNVEQLQRWQTRLAGWDIALELTDETGGLETLTKEYGTPVSDGSTWLTRLLDAYGTSLGAGFSLAEDSAGVTVTISLRNVETDSGQTAYWPFINVEGQTFAQVDGDFYFPQIYVSEGAEEGVRVSFGELTIKDGVDTFTVPLWRDVLPEGMVLALYEITRLEVKATEYLEG